MEVDVLDDGAQVVRISGRLDSPGVDRLETRFTAMTVASGRHTAVDLAGVSFVASMGIRMFIATARALQQRGKRMVLFGASEPVQEVLDIVALDQLVPVAPGRDDALAALRAA